MLTEMMVRQENVKQLLLEIREEKDKTLEIGLASKLGYPDEIVTALILAQLEHDENPSRDIEVMDLLWAGAILDHLDTQGFAIRRKMIRKARG